MARIENFQTNRRTDKFFTGLYIILYYRYVYLHASFRFLSYIYINLFDK